MRARGESKIKYREGKKRRKKNDEYRESGPERQIKESKREEAKDKKKRWRYIIKKKRERGLPAHFQCNLVAVSA